ncbi:LysM peptidoglycan-binding domain-containing protein [Candidatus Microgenomates bacterium]|nr:LysM peptidoglycan-binding domain-containing protein [Candidatus Microgenomates bacterium]
MEIQKWPKAPPNLQNEFLRDNYVVQPGDTLTRIAEIYFTTPGMILESNKLDNPSLLKPGQVLNIAYPSKLGEVKPNVIENPYVINDFNYLSQRYADLELEGKYYFKGELDNLAPKLEGLAHTYGWDKEKESLNEKASSGHNFDPNQMGCAYWMAPIGSVVKVTLIGIPGRTIDKKPAIYCQVLDRGPDRLIKYPPDELHKEPYFKNVIVDLTPASAEALLDAVKLNPKDVGEFRVQVELVSTPAGYEQIKDKLPHKLP